MKRYRSKYFCIVHKIAKLIAINNVQNTVIRLNIFFLYFNDLQLYITINTKFCSFVIFGPKVTSLGHLFMYFPMLLLEMCLRGRMISDLCLSPFTKYTRAGSILVQFWSLWALLFSTQMRLYIQ